MDQLSQSQAHPQVSTQEPPQVDSVLLESDFTKFSPKDSGQFDRFLFKQPIKIGESSALNQMVGNQVYNSGVTNPNDYVYQRTMEFPQPSIAGIGSVTAAGAKDTSTYFFSQNWTITKGSAGVYTINHNIGERKYNVLITAIATSNLSAKLDSFGNNSFKVLSFDGAGTPTDCAFTFVVFIIP